MRKRNRSFVLAVVVSVAGIVASLTPKLSYGDMLNQDSSADMIMSSKDPHTLVASRVQANLDDIYANIPSTTVEVTAGPECSTRLQSTIDEALERGGTVNIVAEGENTVCEFALTARPLEKRLHPSNSSLRRLPSSTR